jgi:hypothetical protein
MALLRSINQNPNTYKGHATRNNVYLWLFMIQSIIALFVFFKQASCTGVAQFLCLLVCWSVLWLLSAMGNAFSRIVFEAKFRVGWGWSVGVLVCGLVCL